MFEMPKYFYMMIGFPGCGKSTWVKNNVDDLNSTSRPVVHSSDNIIEEWAKNRGKTYSDIFSDSIELATKKFFRDLTDSFENGDNVLVDRTNLSINSRKKILQMVPKDQDYKKIAVHVFCNEDELFNRLNNRVGKSIPENVIRSMIKSFQEPSLEEGFDDIYKINSGVISRYDD
jgi:predicted kinase